MAGEGWKTGNDRKMKRTARILWVLAYEKLKAQSGREEEEERRMRMRRRRRNGRRWRSERMRVRVRIVSEGERE